VVNADEVLTGRRVQVIKTTGSVPMRLVALPRAKMVDAWMLEACGRRLAVTRFGIR